MMMMMVMMMMMMMMMFIIIANISAGHGGDDRGMRRKKFLAVVRVVVPRARDAMWQSCTMAACIRIAYAGIRAARPDFSNEASRPRIVMGG